MKWLLIIVLWLLFAIGVGTYAATKGRDATGWFVLSLLFSPLIAFDILAVLQPVAGSRPRCFALARTWEKRVRA